MNARTELLQLQWAQLKHDESYHKDIVLLPIAQRIKHMALHHAKYTAYFFAASDTNDELKLRKTLVDAFIILLATANTLNQELSADLSDIDWETLEIADLGRLLSAQIGRDESDHLWLVRNYARITGRLAKICESWDHLENIPFRNGMKEANIDLLKIILAEASIRQIDLSQEYKTRSREVESRSIFDGYMQNEGRK